MRDKKDKYLILFLSNTHIYRNLDRVSGFVAFESRAFAINQHLHLVKGAERHKGVVAKKGVGSRSPSLITLVIPL